MSYFWEIVKTGLDEGWLVFPLLLATFAYLFIAVLVILRIIKILNKRFLKKIW